MATTLGAATIAACLIGVTMLSGCGAVLHPRAAGIVASTDVWGSVARAVAGGHIPVHSLLTGANTDPHAYAASPSDAAAIVDSTLVVYNGGGYDPWVDQVLARHPAVQSIDAYAFIDPSKTRAGGEPPNEHVFYDLTVAKAVAASIADRLAVIDPANGAGYRANAAVFGRDADVIAASERSIAASYPSAGVISTEPVGFYLLTASGLVDRTPATFAEANENETDPSPADMASVLELIDHRRVSALLVNPQASNAAVSGAEDAARRAGIPVAELTETMPDGTDYLTWQRNTVARLTAALQASR